MSRVHWMKDRVKITRKISTLNRGIVENLNRGIIEEQPDKYDAADPERSEITDWIPARLRSPGGNEGQGEEVKVDLGIVYELVLYGWDEKGFEVCPKQHDELIIKYARDGDLVETTQRLRITGTIKETRKRSKLYSYVMPVVMDTEM